MKKFLFPERPVVQAVQDLAKTALLVSPWDRYADGVASKQRHSGKARAPRHGLSGNPQRRAGQLAQQRPGRTENFSLPDMPYARGRAAGTAPGGGATHP